MIDTTTIDNRSLERSTSIDNNTLIKVPTKSSVDDQDVVEWPIRSPPLRPRNTFFIGREKVLKDIENHLLHGTNADTALTRYNSDGIQQEFSGLRSCVLCSLAGGGKTQIAQEYAHRYGARYEAIFFLSACSETKLTASLIACAKELFPELAQTSASEKPDLEPLRSWLEGTSKSSVCPRNKKLADTSQREAGSLCLIMQKISIC